MTGVEGGAMAWSEEEMLEGQVRAFGLAFGHFASMAATAACQLGIPDMLASSSPQGLTSLEMAHMLGQDAPRHTQELDRLMRVLSFHGIFAVAGDGPSSKDNSPPRYKLTAISRSLCLHLNSGQDSVYPFLRLFMSLPLLAAWHQLPARILKGVDPFQQANDGMDLWSFIRAHPEFSQTFNDAVTCSTRISVKALLDAYPGFATTHTLVDVGGGDGTAVGSIVQRYPHIHGINLELANVVARAPALQGVQHICGDMFEFIPSCDTILLKWVLHAWDDEKCIKILENCHKALSIEGKLIIMDAILDQDVGAMNKPFNMMRMDIDIHLMVATPGGKERTMSEFHNILHASGFKLSKTIDLPCFECAIEAFPIANAS